jgi:hypothetical protein
MCSRHPWWQCEQLTKPVYMVGIASKGVSVASITGPCTIITRTMNTSTQLAWDADLYLRPEPFDPYLRYWVVDTI